ncbi:sulfite exporter TauE/SafE family protein [Kordia sp.]|uniref:sulfite exporter TauE/SafE family protein n=1 Tax=Kordia sp. TaxID=1965332 RepID=UPI003D6AC4A8
MEYLDYAILILAGFGAGFINTLAGGGTLLTLPTLIFLGLPPAVANGTNRVAILIQTFFAIRGFKSKQVSTYPFSLYLGIAAFFGSFIGARIAVDIKGELFNKILAIIMVAVVVLIAIQPKLNLKELQERLHGKYLWASVIAFFFLGIYGGFINAGIGFLMLLWLPYVNRMSLLRSNATKVFVVCLYTISAVIMFAYHDKINWFYGLVLAIGNASGAWIGSRWSVKKGDGIIKTFVIIMVGVMAVKLWFF